MSLKSGFEMCFPLSTSRCRGQNTCRISCKSKLTPIFVIEFTDVPRTNVVVCTSADEVALLLRQTPLTKLPGLGSYGKSNAIQTLLRPNTVASAYVGSTADGHASIADLQRFTVKQLGTYLYAADAPEAREKAAGLIHAWCRGSDSRRVVYVPCMLHHLSII